MAAIIVEAIQRSGEDHSWTVLGSTFTSTTC